MLVLTISFANVVYKWKKKTIIAPLLVCVQTQTLVQNTLWYRSNYTAKLLFHQSYLMQWLDSADVVTVDNCRQHGDGAANGSVVTMQPAVNNSDVTVQSPCSHCPVDDWWISSFAACNQSSDSNTGLAINDHWYFWFCVSNHQSCSSIYCWPLWFCESHGFTL